MSDTEKKELFRTYEGFWRYCRGACPDFKTGCALTCEYRKRLGIPPFGKSYDDKEAGAIRV